MMSRWSPLCSSPVQTWSCLLWLHARFFSPCRWSQVKGHHWWLTSINLSLLSLSKTEPFQNNGYKQRLHCPLQNEYRGQISLSMSKCHPFVGAWDKKKKIVWMQPSATPGASSSREYGLRFSTAQRHLYTWTINHRVSVKYSISNIFGQCDLKCNVVWLASPHLSLLPAATPRAVHSNTPKLQSQWSPPKGIRPNMARTPSGTPPQGSQLWTVSSQVSGNGGLGVGCGFELFPHMTSSHQLNNY